jgi:hypothetical protein
LSYWPEIGNTTDKAAVSITLDALVRHFTRSVNCSIGPLKIEDGGLLSVDLAVISASVGPWSLTCSSQGVRENKETGGCLLHRAGKLEDLNNGRHNTAGSPPARYRIAGQTVSAAFGPRRLIRLWEIAIAHALVRALGEDRVQAIISEAFAATHQEAA